MHMPVLAILLLAVQSHPKLDSASVSRVLAQLKTSDSIVCALAGQALTNYGGFRGWGYADPGMPMPRPMPTPMPMPNGGGGGGGHINFNIDEASDGIDRATLGAFRAMIRDENRCVRNIAARVLGSHGGSGTYELFLGLLREARTDLRETGALGLGELEDTRAIGPLSDVLGRDAEPSVRMTAAWALGEIEDMRAVRPLSVALNDASLDVRLAAVWALGEIEDADAVPILITATKDRDPRLRQAAAWLP